MEEILKYPIELMFKYPFYTMGIIVALIIISFISKIRYAKSLPKYVIEKRKGYNDKRKFYVFVRDRIDKYSLIHNGHKEYFDTLNEAKDAVMERKHKETLEETFFL